MLYRAIDRCRACSGRVAQVLDLGLFSLSDFKESPNAFTDSAPLVLVRCEDCTLVQLAHTVERDRLYTQYWYRSAVQPAMVQTLRSVVHECLEWVPLREGDTVIDIGANDGTLLRMYPDTVIRVAYEPAQNLWPVLQSEQGGFSPTGRGICLAGAYWPTLIQNEPIGANPGAKIITSIACFYDVDNPNHFVEGIKKSLAHDGVWVNQMAYLPATVAVNNFGDICHEHLTYWTLNSFSTLLRKHGLEIADYSLNDVNGGSLRTVVRHAIGKQAEPNFFEPVDMDQFAVNIRNQRARVRDFLMEMRMRRQTVIGYGASTKGNTYLQYWGVRPHLLGLIADRNPDKWGTFTPTGQEVISEAEARERRPDYFFVLPWHFLPAFIEREHEYLKSGGWFAVPFPEFRIVGATHGTKETSPPQESDPSHDESAAADRVEASDEGTDSDEVPRPDAQAGHVEDAQEAGHAADAHAGAAAAAND